MGTAMKHPVPDRVKPSFAIFDIRTLRAERQSAQMSKIAAIIAISITKAKYLRISYRNLG